MHSLQIIIILILVSGVSQAQSIKYECVLHTGRKTGLLIESVELKPDSTFSWMSEYDLPWEETGTYSINRDTLTLNVEMVMDFPEQNAKLRKYLVTDDELFFLSKADKRVKRLHYRFADGFKYWLRAYRFNYHYRRVDKFIGRR